jgi:hypothetical protein
MNPAYLKNKEDIGKKEDEHRKVTWYVGELNI